MNIFQDIEKGAETVAADIEKAGQWVGDKFKEGITDAGPIIVNVLQVVKTGLQDGVIVDGATLIDSAFHTDIADFIKNNETTILNGLMIAIADVTGLEVLASGATPDQVAAFFASASKAFLSGTAYDKSAIIADLGAKLYEVIAPLLPQVAAGTVTKAAIISAIEACYQDFLSAQAQLANTSVDAAGDESTE